MIFFSWFLLARRVISIRVLLRLNLVPTLAHNLKHMKGDGDNTTSYPLVCGGHITTYPLSLSDLFLSSGQWQDYTVWSIM
jgi:hypothetical protein